VRRHRHSCLSLAEQSRRPLSLENGDFIGGKEHNDHIDQEKPSEGPASQVEHHYPKVHAVSRLRAMHRRRLAKAAFGHGSWAPASPHRFVAMRYVKLGQWSNFQKCLHEKHMDKKQSLWSRSNLSQGIPTTIW